MRRQGSNQTFLLALRIVGLALVYVVGARIGLKLAVSNRNVTAVWPPTGIAVAGLLVWGWRVWPGIAVGAFVANVTNGASASTAAAITLGNTLAPLAGVWLMRKVFRTSSRLDSLKDVLALVGIGGFGAMTISATCGTAALALTHALSGSSVASVWIVWWVGDAIGVVLFAPLLIQLAHVDRSVAILRRPLETVALFVATGALTFALFRVSVQVPYIVFGLIVWIAIRLGRLGAAIATVVVTVVAVALTVAGYGPFTFGTATENLVSLQSFNAAVGFTSLALAVVLLERRRIGSALRSSERRYRSLFEQAEDLVCILDLEGRLVYVNAAGERLTGYNQQRLRSMSLDDLVTPEYVPVVRRSIAKQLSGPVESTTYEIDLMSSHGRRFSLEASSTLVYDGDEPSGFQVIGRDITSRRGAEDELRRLALRDELTSLANRTLIEERINFALAIAGRDRSTVAVALLDVDSFAAVNDEHGRRAGDEVLKEIAERLTEAFRAPETVGRLGADTFVAMIPRFAADSTPSIVGERMIEVIDAPFEIDGGRAQLTASVGIGLSTEPGDTAKDLIARADIAMRSVKQNGGGAYTHYRHDMDTGRIRSRSLVEDLERDGVEPYLTLLYQPKVEITTLRTAGVEALLRFTSTNLGLVAPDEFLDAAERAGLGEDIARWVLAESLDRLRQWDEAGIDLTVAVNVSSRLIADGSIIEIARSALSASPLATDRLILEIKERDAVDPAATDVLRRLRDIGVKLCVDDFGAGPSSVVQLGHAPVDEVKIDASLVAGLCARDADHAIVRSLIDVARNLGLRTVAQGVEARDVWKVLHTLGCDQAQGFLLSPPLTATELGSWLRTPAWSGRTH